MDHVTVFFDERLAKEFHVGLETFDSSDPSHLRREAEMCIDIEIYDTALEFLKLAKRATENEDEKTELQQLIEEVEEKLK